MKFIDGEVKFGFPATVGILSAFYCLRKKHLVTYCTQFPCFHSTFFANGVMERPTAARVPLPPPLLLSLLRPLFLLRHCHLVRHCGVDADGLDGSDERRQGERI